VAARRTATRTSVAIARALPCYCANRCADIPRRCMRCFPATARTLRGCYPANARMIHRMLRRLCVDCGGKYQVICEPSRQLWCKLWRGHSSAFCEMSPANCPDTSRLLHEYCADVARMLRGRCPNVARMIRRMLRRTPRRMLRGNCAAVARFAALFSDKGMVSNQNDRLSNSRKPPKIPFD